jgi:hypothetical protein
VLSEEERYRIKEEEIFREEVRRSLQPPAAKSFFESRAWKLLNASIVLWLLSSVVVAGLTQWYSHQQSVQAERAGRRELQRKLEAEIGNRLRQTINGLEVWKRNVARGGFTGTTQGTYNQMASYLNNTAGPNVDYSVFPEYRSRTFSSLLMELGPLLEAGDRGDVANALGAYEQIAVRSSDAAGGQPNTREQAIKATDDALAFIHTHFQKPRWSVGLYPQPSTK